MPQMSPTMLSTITAVSRSACWRLLLRGQAERPGPKDVILVLMPGHPNVTQRQEAATERPAIEARTGTRVPGVRRSGGHFLQRRQCARRTLLSAFERSASADVGCSRLLLGFGASCRPRRELQHGRKLFLREWCPGIVC
jgi:hypothetical protein